MICEKCKKNEATIHLSEVIKDIKSEIHLCEVCAREVGLNTKISNFSLSLPEMLTFLNFDEAADYTDPRRCDTCGCDFIDYKKEGKLGCPECYNNLAEYLEPVLSGFHGDKRHIGKFPVYNEVAGTVNRVLNEVKDTSDGISDLQAKLELAVSEEKYEEAALLRDRIREITLSIKKNE